MRNLIFIGFLMLTGCSAPTYFYKVHNQLVDEPEPILIQFNTELEAKIVQNKIAKHCTKPTRINRYLFLHREQLTCTRFILGHDYGFIRKKYRAQINRQLNDFK